MINPLSRINFTAIQERITTYKSKVVQSTLPILKIIGQAMTFPLRWAGSKTYSIPGIIVRFPVVAAKHLLGKNDPATTFKDELLPQKGYTWFTHKDLSSEEAKEYMLYATAAGCIHRNNVNWLKPFGFVPIKADTFAVDAEKIDNIIFDRATGLKIGVFQKDNEIIVVFGALKTHESQFAHSEYKEADKLTRKVQVQCISSLLGGKPEMYTKADLLVGQLMQSNRLKNKKVTICGQSLGGSLASYVGLRQQIPTVALNAFPLGTGLQQKIGAEKLHNADQVVTNIRVKGDYWSDLPWIVKTFDVCVNALGLKTPGNFGKLLDVPAIHKKSGITHVDVYGAIAAKWKPEFKPLCLDRFEFTSATQKSSSKKLAELVAKEFAAKAA